MFPLVLGITTALAAALMHAACIRIVKPRSKFLSLLVLEALALTMGATLLARSDAGASDWVAGVVLSLSLTGGYLATFVGVVQDSPTLALVNYILDFGSGGMPLQAVGAFVERHPFVDSRIEAMLDAGVLESDGHCLTIGPKTKILLYLAFLYERICGDTPEAG